MLRIFLFVTILFFSTSCDNKAAKIPQINTKAPSFSGLSQIGEIDFPKDFEGKWTVLFCLPSAEGTVCRTEIKGLLEEKDFFEENNCALIGITCASMESINKSISERQKEALTQRSFPIISDTEKKIAKKYGMYQPCMSCVKLTRMIVFISPDQKVKALFVYPLFNGRNVKEIKRTLLALQLTEKEKKVTPLNWKKGKEAYKCKHCMSKLFSFLGI